MSQLKLVQAGIQRHTCNWQTRTVKSRLPITPVILHKIWDYWLPKSAELDVKMLWTAVVIYFFGFFCSGEITVPSHNSFDPFTHLAWRDASFDNVLAPTMLKVHLKKSKTDELKRGQCLHWKDQWLFVSCGSRGRIYVHRRLDCGPFFKFLNGQPLTKSRFTQCVQDAL